MRLKLFAASFAALAATSATAQQPGQPPKLIVAIAVDQFSADLYDEYRPHFTAGLARLGSGVAFHNGYQSHNATETCPGHSTILTGSHPSRTGIIANIWFDLSQQRSDKAVYCAEDERVPGTSSLSYTVSPMHLMVPTLGEWIKQTRPGSRNVAVAGKDRAAVMMTGHKADQRWYWFNDKFVTDLKGVTVPQTVAKANAAIAKSLHEDRQPLQTTPLCQAKARVFPVEGGASKPVGNGAFERLAEDQAGFRASPELDGDTLAIAAGLVDEMHLGRGADPDVLAISLSATDYVGHSYGTEGQEMCLQMLALDRELGDFFAFLDGRGIDYSVVLTADHGGLDAPERQRGAGHPDAARIDAALNAGKIGLELVKQYNLPGFGLYGESFGDIYVDRSLTPPQQKLVIDGVVAAYRAHPQVEAVFTAEQLAATPVPTGSPVGWSLIQRARASYYPGRSGDFVVLLKKNVTPIADTSRYIATHGSPWDYDRRVPILFWRKGTSPLALDTPIETTDILPTLAATIGLAIPSGSIDGHCLAAVVGNQCMSR